MTCKGSSKACFLFQKESEMMQPGAHSLENRTSPRTYKGLNQRLTQGEDRSARHLSACPTPTHPSSHPEADFLCPVILSQGKVMILSPLDKEALRDLSETLRAGTQSNSFLRLWISRKNLPRSKKNTKMAFDKFIVLKDVTKWESWDICFLFCLCECMC